MCEELEYTSCPLCDSKDYSNLFVGNDFLFSKKDFVVVTCRTCGLTYTNPRIKENMIANYYFSDYLPNNETETPLIIQRIKKIVGHLFEHPYLKIFHELSSINTKTVLEIGPGSGDLLYFLKEKGLNVCGVEMDSQCCAKIRNKGILCFQGDLRDVITEIGSKKFDAILLHHAFEHLYDPKRVLCDLYNLLNENGRIILSIPNFDSIEARLFGKYWKGLDLPRHVAHYDRKSIERLFSEANFKIIELNNDSFPSSFIESIGFLFFRRRMPLMIYYLLYYPWKLLAPIHTKLIGSGVMKIVAVKIGNSHDLLIKEA